MPYDIHKPIAWVGADKSDRMLIADVTKYGLHRTVVARKDDVMDVEAWQQAVASEAMHNPVDGFLIEMDGFFILWLVWKEAKR